MLARVAHEHPNAGVLEPPHPDPEALATALAAYEGHRNRGRAVAESRISEMTRPALLRDSPEDGRGL